MFKDFKNYDEFMLEYNMAKDNYNSYNRYLNIFSLKSTNINYKSKNSGRYEYLRSKVSEAKDTLTQYEELSEEMFYNQKTNGEMLDLILKVLNENVILNSRYSARIITVSSDNLSKVRIKDNIEFKLDKGSNNNATSYILLVRNDFKNSKINETFNSSNYAKYQKEGNIIELDKYNGSLDSESKLNSYLSQKTINIDNAKGMRSITIEIIKEELFNDYKAKENTKPKTLKKEK